jgi:hypothetical protein
MADGGFMDKIGGAGTLASIGQIGFGIYDRIAGSVQRKKAEREFAKHPYEVPGSVNKMLDVVRGVASQRKLPGQEFAEQQIGATTAQGVEAATRVGRSASDALGALESLYGQQQQRQQSLALAGAQNWQENQMRYANTLERMGAYEDQKWQYNYLYPYMQRMTGAGEMQMAGNTNLGSGISGLVSTDYANRELKAMQDKWNKDREAGLNFSNPYRNYTSPSYGNTIINNDGSIING